MGKSDIEIAREARLPPIETIAETLRLSAADLEFYGPDKAKIGPDTIAGLADRPDGALVLVTAMTLGGQGKSMTTVGLGDVLSPPRQALDHDSSRAFARTPLRPQGRSGRRRILGSTRPDLASLGTGSIGGVDLAAAVLEAMNGDNVSNFRYLYPDDLSLQRKIEVSATTLYGADTVRFLPPAVAKLSRYETVGYGQLPVCMAKTHGSLSDDAKRPSDVRAALQPPFAIAGSQSGRVSWSSTPET